MGLQPAFSPQTPTPSVLCPHSSSLLALNPSILSLTCYLLLLIPFALKPDQVPHPTRALFHAALDLLSLTVCAARVPVKGAAVRDPQPCQPARTEPCRLRMKGGGPVLLSAARPLHTLAAAPFSPCYLLLLISHPPFFIGASCPPPTAYSPTNGLCLALHLSTVRSWRYPSPFFSCFFCGHPRL